MRKPLRNDSVVVFGKGSLAIEICEYLMGEGIKLVVVPVEPEPNWTLSLISHSKERGWKLVSWEIFKEQKENYIFGISVYFDRVFDLSTINRFDLLLNLHNSPLPKYRGVNPINWALKNQEEVHGVTIHRVEEGIDTGDIFGQVTFPIDAVHDEVEDVYNRCLSKGEELFKKVFTDLEHITPRKQDDTSATYYSKADFSRLKERSHFRRNLDEIK